MAEIIRISPRERAELRESPRSSKIDSLEGLLDTFKSTRFTVILIFIQSFQWALASQLYVMAAYLAPVGNALEGEFKTVQDTWDNIPVIASIDASEFVSSATFLGSLCLGFLPGLLGDRYGRKKILVLSLLSIAATGVASSLAHSYIFLLIFRFIQGFFLTAIATINFVHCSESIASSRIYIAECAFGLFWCLGYAVLAPTSLLVGSWRWMIGVHNLVSALMCLVVAFLLPESPRHAIAANKREMLEDFVKKAEWWNRSYYDVDFDSIMMEREITTPGSKSVLGSIRCIFREKQLLILLAVQGYIQVATLLAYTGLSIASTALEVGDANWNFVLSGLVELPAYCGTPKFIHWFGTKRVMLAVFVGASVSLIVLKFIGPSMPVLFLIVWLISKFLVTSCYYVSLIVSTELFPTKCRSFAVAFGLTLSNIGSIFGPHVGTLNVISPDLAFVVFGLFLAVASLLIALFIPKHSEFEA